MYGAGDRIVADGIANLEGLLGDSPPVAYVRREGILLKEDTCSLDRHSLDYLRNLCADGPAVFSKGMAVHFSDSRDQGDATRRVQAAAGCTSFSRRTSWVQAAGFLRCGGRMMRIHGKGIGEPGILLPANSELVIGTYGRKAGEIRGVSSRIPEPGYSTILLRRMVCPRDTSPVDLVGVDSEYIGFVLGALFLRGSELASGLFRVRSAGTKVEEALGIAADRSGVGCLSGSVLTVHGPVRRLAAQMCRGYVPAKLYRASDRLWSGMFKGLSPCSLRMRVRGVARMAVLYRMLCRAGQGYRTGVHVHGNGGWICIGKEKYERDVWKTVQIEFVSAPAGLFVPVSRDWLAHMSGVVFRVVL